MPYIKDQETNLLMFQVTREIEPRKLGASDHWHNYWSTVSFWDRLSIIDNSIHVGYPLTKTIFLVTSMG